MQVQADTYLEHVHGDAASRRLRLGDGHDRLEPGERAVDRRLEEDALAGDVASAAHQHVSPVGRLQHVGCVGAEVALGVREAPVGADAEYLAWVFFRSVFFLFCRLLPRAP